MESFFTTSLRNFIYDTQNVTQNDSQNVTKNEEGRLSLDKKQLSMWVVQKGLHFDFYSL